MITSLLKAEAYPHPVNTIQLIETHISWVLLTGKYAYKIKKPVNFGFLDFSTLEQRHFFCHEEIRLNQRLAADWYIGVVPITEQDGHMQMNGAGVAVEYAVKMRQFPSTQTLKDCSETNPLPVNAIDQMADIVAHFHHTIESVHQDIPYGDCQDIKQWFIENFGHIWPLLDNNLHFQQLKFLEVWSDAEWQRKAPFMQRRNRQGYVRECHGDLHLGNMMLVKGKVVLFDCIEFNPKLRWIDVISEVAFLVMDLIHVGHAHYAYRFLNRYLQHTGDYQGLGLLRYYLVYRALVRAKVALLRISQHPAAEICTQARNEYALFDNLAERFTHVTRPRLLITHGFSGSGKSWFAAQLAEQISAIQIRSDIERKRLFGYTAQTATGSAIDKGIYTQAAGLKTYQQLAELAKAVLNAGFSVIVDATFLQRAQRNLFQKLAHVCGVAFYILDFQAATETLANRITQRHHDPSEATLAVLYQQQQSAQAFTAEELPYLIAVNTEQDDALPRLLNFMTQPKGE